MLKYICMEELAFRLHKGDDLKACIEEKCKDINTAVVISGVGCIYHARIRLAGGKDYYEAEKDFEIVSLTGTVSNGRCHIHICLSDDKGNVIGGHLEKGCLINTTCELVFKVLQEYESIREYDDSTGYSEIRFIKNGQ